MNGVKDIVKRVGIVGEIFEGRDTERQRELDARAHEAMERVNTETIREIEEDYEIDEYAYPSGHSGYATHQRNRRPRSRSEEVTRYKEAEQSLQRRLDGVADIIKS